MVKISENANTGRLTNQIDRDIHHKHVESEIRSFNGVMFVLKDRGSLC